MSNAIFPSFLCQIEEILCAFNLFVRLTWLRNYDVRLSRWIDLNSAFQSSLLFYLLSNSKVIRSVSIHDFCEFIDTTFRCLVVVKGNVLLCMSDYTPLIE